MNTKKPREIVIVFPFNTETKQILIIEEYIQHYKRPFWKFVSGGVDKSDKNFLEHVEEELAEEVGMESDNTYHFHTMEKIFGNRGTHFFVAENPKHLENPPLNPDVDVIYQSKWITEQQFNEMLDSKELLWDEITMGAVMLFRKYQ